MTALFGAAFTGIGLLADIDSGLLDRLLATPLRRGAVITAAVVAGRAGYSGGTLAAAAAPLALLALFAAACTAFATRSFARYRRSL